MHTHVKDIIVDCFLLRKVPIDKTVHLSMGRQTYASFDRTTKHKLPEHQTNCKTFTYKLSSTP